MVHLVLHHDNGEEEVYLWSDGFATFWPRFVDGEDQLHSPRTFQWEEPVRWSIVDCNLHFTKIAGDDEHDTWLAHREIREAYDRMLASLTMGPSDDEKH